MMMMTISDYVPIRKHVQRRGRHNNTGLRSKDTVVELEKGDENDY